MGVLWVPTEYYKFKIKIMPGKLLRRLFKKTKPPKNKKVVVKKGIDPKTGYRYGYKPHYLPKDEAAIGFTIGLGGTAATIAAVEKTKRERIKSKINKKEKKQFGGAVGPNGIL